MLRQCRYHPRERSSLKRIFKVGALILLTRSWNHDVLASTVHPDVPSLESEDRESSETFEEEEAALKRASESSSEMFDEAEPAIAANTAQRCRWGEHCPDQPQQQSQQQQQQQQQREQQQQPSTPPHQHHQPSSSSQNDNTSHIDAAASAAAFVKTHTVTHHKQQQQQQQHAAAAAAATTTTTTTQHAHRSGPPEAFVLTARVYTDPDDKLAHFDDDDHPTSLPYWECGVSGSTTSPLLLKHAYFRHAFAGSQPTRWSGTEYGPHPQLLLPLKPLQIVLNSGETKEFAPGSVILLEDVLSAGHKLVSASSHSEDVSAVLLTLPQHYHHVGKDRLSLLMDNNKKNSSPCPNDASSLSTTTTTTATGSMTQAATALLWTTQTRQVLFASVGLALSSLMAVFLGKVAPLWLSVGVGGACFITGGTYAAVACGEYLTQEFELWYEQRRLKDASFMQEDNGEEEREELLVDVD